MIAIRKSNQQTTKNNLTPMLHVFSFLSCSRFSASLIITGKHKNQAGTLDGISGAGGIAIKIPFIVKSMKLTINENLYEQSFESYFIFLVLFIYVLYETHEHASKMMEKKPADNLL